MLLLALAMAQSTTGAIQPAAEAPMAATAAPTTSMPATAQSVTTAVPEPAGPASSAAGTVDAAGTAPAPVAAGDVTSMTPSATLESPGAATPDSASSGYTMEPRDPWVKVNRAIFSVDIALERGLLAPVAHGYAYVVPKVVRYHVTNGLYNLEEPLTAVNDLLQLRIGAMSKTIFRFVVNSTIGVAGLFDVAKSAGVPIHFSLFGQTLGRYGVKAGPYIMLPILGPSDLRDGIGQLVDGLIDPVQLLVGGLTSADGLSLFVLEGVDWRSRSDETLKAVYSATDPYAFVRSAYTQSRVAAVAEATGKAAALPDFDAVPGTP